MSSSTYPTTGTPVLPDGWVETPSTRRILDGITNRYDKLMFAQMVANSPGTYDQIESHFANLPPSDIAGYHPQTRLEGKLHPTS